MKIVTVRNLVIGEGAPKIIVPLMSKDIAAVKSKVLAYREADFDILEWRVDYFTGVSSIETVSEAVRTIHDVMADKPLLFTFRGTKEGGEQALSVGYYIALNRAAVDSDLADMIDLELSTGDELTRATVEHVHVKNVFVVTFNHDFHKTPATEEIAQRSHKVQELGVDILKIALMPQNKADVLTLLGVTLEM